jgi:glycosyltransferase involved in cell wall biosynthesis
LEERKDPILALAIREWELRSGIMEDRPVVFVGQGALDMAGRIRALEKSFPGRDVARLISGCGDEELVALYRNAQATLVTSHLEGFSLIPLEAMGCGCPLIVSDLPAHRELLQGSATILGTRDPAEWGKALLTLTSAPELSPRSAGECVLASLSWDAAAKAFATDVRSLLSR